MHREHDTKTSLHAHTSMHALVTSTARRITPSSVKLTQAGIARCRIILAAWSGVAMQLSGTLSQAASWNVRQNSNVRHQPNHARTTSPPLPHMQVAHSTPSGPTPNAKPTDLRSTEQRSPIWPAGAPTPRVDRTHTCDRMGCCLHAMHATNSIPCSGTHMTPAANLTVWH
jgi:hypothetical protein